MAFIGTPGPELHPGRSDRFRLIRQATLALAAPLSAEDCAIQSMPDASPVKWHLGHTTWFFETFVLGPHAPRYRELDPAYRVLFNSYYNAVGDKHPRPERGMLSRPGLAEVHAYRQHVDDAMVALLGSDGCTPDCAALIELGLHHEQQHQELILTDVKHLLSRNPTQPAYQKQWPLTPIRAREPRWIDFEGGLCEIGHGDAGFCFDNETPRHRVWLEPFQIASHPVTHGDFIRFIDDGGYRRPELWLAPGWETRATLGWQGPQSWAGGREGNTTASSCPANMCCAAAPVRRPKPTPARPIEFSSRRRRAGSSRDCAWRATPSELLGARA